MLIPTRCWGVVCPELKRSRCDAKHDCGEGRRKKVSGLRMTRDVILVGYKTLMSVIFTPTEASEQAFHLINLPFCIQDQMPRQIHSTEAQQLKDRTLVVDNGAYTIKAGFASPASAAEVSGT